MNTRLLPVVAAALLLVAPADAAEDASAAVKQARTIARDFMTTLKGELMRAMEDGGPAHAIEVCKAVAPRIAEDESRKFGWHVARTSHRVRNPANAPDAWERKILASFLARAERGENLKAMEYGEVIETGDRRVFRYMKAIPTQALCLNCHGSDLQPEVTARLAELYPDDRATGFEVGDLRGAFTFSKRLD